MAARYVTDTSQSSQPDEDSKGGSDEDETTDGTTATWGLLGSLGSACSYVLGGLGKAFGREKVDRSGLVNYHRKNCDMDFERSAPKKIVDDSTSTNTEPPKIENKLKESTENREEEGGVQLGSYIYTQKDVNKDGVGSSSVINDREDTADLLTINENDKPVEIFSSQIEDFKDG